MINSKQLTLSEVTSKQILKKFGVTFAQESEVSSAKDAADVASKIGFPVAIKVCANAISHKTERGLVRLNIRNTEEALTAANDLLKMTTKADGDVSLLVAKMESGRRELIVGLVRDPQFGALVMCGLGGIYAEVFSDIVFAPAPLSKQGALQMLTRLKNQTALREFRGESAVDTSQLGDILVAVSNAGVDDPSIISVDINPVIVRADGSLVAVDALVVKQEPESLDKAETLEHHQHLSDDHFVSLFEPRGVVVVGASTHPGKFGFVSLHNILASGYAGKIFATNLEKATVLGINCLASVDDLPENEVDLAFICTPASTNLEILRACARKSIRAVYVTSAGYGEAGDAGRKAQEELQALATELGILLLGPNGQGIVSTPKNLCAQIVGPYPPSGSISLISQSGNFVSSFMNYSRQTKVGIARAVSAGNAAQVGIPEFFSFYAN
ncbi:MAG: acetate--CoA ligase family protein, partial [Ilumatobacteraceae bacterium]|nr:acetate--CoA ligase family protein [Ilumatobacteraceae bacterium]